MFLTATAREASKSNHQVKLKVAFQDHSSERQLSSAMDTLIQKVIQTKKSAKFCLFQNIFVSLVAKEMFLNTKVNTNLCILVKKVN